MSSLRRWTRHAHRALALLLLVGVIAQIYMAGLIFYGRLTPHAVTGWVLLLVGILVLLTSAVGHGFKRRTGLAAVLVVCLILQPVFIFVLAPVSVFMGALHPLNGLVIVGLSAWLVWDHPDSGASADTTSA